jgi:hypothetical protein
MKRLVWLLPLVTVILVAANPTWSYQPESENSSWTQSEEKVAGSHPGYESFQKECEDAWKTIKKTLQTYVHTVVTVVKALVGVIHTVLLSIAKLVIRFSVAFVLIVVRWLFGAFLPL